MRSSQFRTEQDWKRVLDSAEVSDLKTEISVPSRWEFEDLTIVPKEINLDLLNLTIGSHDPEIQKFANKFLPCGVFNLSITPGAEIEKTHNRMKEDYNKGGGSWSREKMPRTVLVFLNNDSGVGDIERDQRAGAVAKEAIANYWKALAGTIDEAKVKMAVENALVGSPKTIIQQMKTQFSPDDRLMLWFDFHNHDNDLIKKSMSDFMKEVAPYV